MEVDLTTALNAIAAGQMPALLPTEANGVEKILAGYEDLGSDFSDWLATRRRFAQAQLLRALERVWRDGSAEPATRRRFAEAALRLYEARFEAMDRLLDMEPPAATIEMVAAIKMGALDRSAPAQPPATRQRPEPAKTLQGVPVVAILPLHVSNGDDPAVWVAQALVEDTMRILAGLREMAVISSNLALRLRGGEANMAQAAA